MGMTERLTKRMLQRITSPAIRGGGAPSLDIRASVGTSTSPTSIGTKDIAVPFESKLFLPFSSFVTAAGSSSEAMLGFGADNGTNAAGIGVSAGSGLTTSITHRRHSATRSVSSVYNNTTRHESSVSALAGLTLNWTTVQAAAAILNHVAIGGADLEVAQIQGQMNNTNLSDPFAHGMSGAPTGGLLFFAAHSTTPADTTGTLKFGMGAFAGSSQWGASIYSNTGVTTTATRRLLSTSHMLADLTTSVQRSAGFASADASNLTLSYPDTGVSTRYYFWAVLFRGAKCQVGTFDCDGSLEPFPIATTGITPKLFLPIFIPNGVDNIGSVLTEVGLTIGASDGTNNVSCGITDANGLTLGGGTTTNARRFQSSSSLVEYSTGGSLRFEGTASFSGESVILDPTTINSGVYGQGAYLVVGA